MTLNARGRLSLPGAYAALTLLAGTGFLAAGCTTGTGSADTAMPAASATALAAPAVQTAPVTSTPSPSPSPLGDMSFVDLGFTGAWYDELPLSDLSPDAAETVDLDGGIGVVVMVPSLGLMYEENGDAQFQTASVVKVPIMLTLLDQAISSHRALTGNERTALTQMIAQSDNSAADALYADVGGGPAVTAFLNRAGIADAVIDPADWGTSTLSPLNGAVLMSELTVGTILDAPSRELALDLLDDVNPSQAWGAVSVAAGAERSGVKNGWYPEADGWVLNSLGFVSSANGVPDYTIAIFTERQPNFYDGIARIEEIGQQVYQALLLLGTTDSRSQRAGSIRKTG